MQKKLGIVLLNQKMKLQLEVKNLEKLLMVSNESFLDKIKKIWKRKKYTKAKAELKLKKDYLLFITKYMDMNKDKMEMIVSDDLVKILVQNDFVRIKNELNKL